MFSLLYTPFTLAMECHYLGGILALSMWYHASISSLTGRARLCPHILIFEYVLQILASIDPPHTADMKSCKILSMKGVSVGVADVLCKGGNKCWLMVVACQGQVLNAD